jgi:RNA polymerase sigma-70 factor (ECF subfamily)
MGGAMEHGSIEDFYRREHGRILSALIRAVGDFELAEDAVQEAFASAIEQWPREGTPDNPRAWIVSVARHKAIDRLRRQARFAERSDELRRLIETEREGAISTERDDAVPDERLSLIFTCCHPALAQEAQIALALRTLCGLRTEEIARAFLVPAATMAQRLVRAKRKIATAGIPYQTPSREHLSARMEAVMAVVYLVFNEGYSATAGSELIRRELAGEAIRLARIIVELMAQEPEPHGLLALMLLHDARRDARLDDKGEIVLLEDQDRSRWNREQIEEGLKEAGVAMETPQPGPYAIQAAIAAEHSRAARPRDTDWRRIADLYGMLMRKQPNPVVELNYAVAVAMDRGCDAGLEIISRIEERGALRDYHLMWAAKADLLRRLGRLAEAEGCYRRALELAGSEPERSFLRKRLSEVSS